MTVIKFYAFEVKRFRSLVDVKINISEAMPVTICGENNVGKTNFLRAMNVFFNNPFNENMFDPKVDIPHHIYEGSRGARSKTELTGYFNDGKTNFQLKTTFKDSGDIEYILKGKKATSDEVKNFLLNYQFIFIESHNIDIPTLISATLEKDGLLPLDSKRAKQSKPLEKLHEFINLSKNAISDIEKEINKNFKKLTDFDGVLKDKSIQINFAEFEKLRDIIKTMTSITLNDGNNHSMASKGSGAQRAVFISLMQFISQNSKRCVIWGIDEPEAFLQPRLQKQVFDVLKEIVSQRKQSVILTTHSQHFIQLHNLSDTHIFKGEITERNYKRRPKEVYYEINTKPILCTSTYEKALLIKEHLGINNNDGWELLPYNILVEGEEDKKYLETLFLHMGIPVQNIIWSGGASKIGGYLQYYNNFAKDLKYKPTVICLFDNDDEGREQSKKIKPSSYSHLCVKIIELVRSDGESPNSKNAHQNWEIEDFLPHELLIDSINAILQKEKYKKITKKQADDRRKQAHIGKQVLKYAEDCTNQNNPNLKPFGLDNEGRKKQICQHFCEQNRQGITLTTVQKNFLNTLIK